MKYLFKDLKGFEDRTLFVIGNGFDLFHDIPSTYMHFYHWLKFKGEDEFISKMEKFFPSMANGEFMLWKDFERALGQFDINEIFEDTIGEIDRKLDERTKVVAIEQLAPIVKQIKPLLRKWIEQIDLSKVKPQLSLPQDSWYISFNYTLTLEKVYNISPDRICHIHNSVSDKTIIVGHKHIVDIDEIGEQNFDWYEECAKKNIGKTMNEMIKLPLRIKSDHEDFFSKIKGLKRIVVLGHSISEIDEDYYGYIRGASDPDAHWHISKYSPSDEAQIANLLNKREIDNENRWIFNM